MGRHADAGRRRGIALWPIVSAVAVIVVAAATVLYVTVIRSGDPDGCTAHATIPVSAAPGSMTGMQAVAAAFDQTKPVARSACLTTAVTAAPADAASALIAGWQGAATGPAPSMWVVDTSAELTTVDRKRPDITAGHDATPIATSPVVLAMRADDAAAVGALSWKDLPTSAGPTGSTTLPGGEHLILALPDPRTNRATGYALQSVVAAQTGSTTPVDVASIAKAAAELRTLGTATANDAADTTARALRQLADGTGHATAVPVVESDLVTFNATAKVPLTAVYLGGPTAGDEITAVPLSAAWVDPTQKDAAAALHSFLLGASGRQALADSGLRVPGTTAHGTRVGVDTAHPVTVLPSNTSVAPSMIDDALEAAIKPDGDPPSTVPPTPPTTQPTPPPTTKPTTTAPTTTPAGPTPTTSAKPTTTPPPKPTGPVVTLLSDTSAPMAEVESGRNWIEWSQRAIGDAVTHGADNDLGLWIAGQDTATAGYLQQVTTGPLTAVVTGSTTRQQALAGAVGGLALSGSSRAYPGIVAAYQDAVAHTVPGRTNKVVAIIGSIDQTPGLPRAQVIGAIQTAAAGHAVQLDIIGVGSRISAAALTEIAQAGGGTFTAVTSGDQLAAALAAAIGG